MNTLHRKIMRRIYYAYTMRIATHTITLQTVLCFFALYVFAKMVHVASVVHNLLSVEVGNAPAYIANAFFHGEALTLIAIGVMMFVALSLPVRVRTTFFPRMQTA